MRKRTFWIIESIMIFITVFGFVSYGVARGLGYGDYPLTSCALGIGIIGLFIFAFFFVMKIFNQTPLPETKQGVVCPRCHFINEEGSELCKQCGHQLKEETDIEIEEKED